MPPLTLTILASVLHMQGGDSTITSENKGIEDLLAPILARLQENAGQENHDGQSREHLDVIAKGCGPGCSYSKGSYVKSSYGKGLFPKTYLRYNATIQSGGSQGRPGGAGTVGSPVRQGGGGSFGGGGGGGGHGGGGHR
jgi:hypothetical protein